MHKSFHAEPIAAFEALIHDAARRGDTPAAILQHASASNDASCESPANCGDDCDDSDSWARHALAANGFGGASATDAGTAMRPVDSPPLRPARVYRSFALKALIAAAIRGARRSRSRR